MCFVPFEDGAPYTHYVSCSFSLASVALPLSFRRDLSSLCLHSLEVILSCLFLATDSGQCGSLAAQLIIAHAGPTEGMAVWNMSRPSQPAIRAFLSLNWGGWGSCLYTEKTLSIKDWLGGSELSFSHFAMWCLLSREKVRRSLSLKKKLKNKELVSCQSFPLKMKAVI